MCVRSVNVKMMNKLLWAAGILILLVSIQVIAEVSERSEKYWEEVGPNVDKSLNPDKYKIE